MIHFPCDKYSYVSFSSPFTLHSFTWYGEYINSCMQDFEAKKERSRIVWEGRGKLTMLLDKWQQHENGELLSIMNSLPVYLLNWSSLNCKFSLHPEYSRFYFSLPKKGSFSFSSFIFWKIGFVLFNCCCCWCRY